MILHRQLSLDNSTIAAWLRLLIEPGQVIELRALKCQRGSERAHTVSGFFDFDHLDQLADTAMRLTEIARGVYLTINPLRQDLLARRCNRCDRAEEGELAADRNVIRRRWLLIDADPVRDPHVSATDSEKALALELLLRVRNYLRHDAGWPAPILADSGNGYHLLYQIDLPAEDGGLVKRILQVIAKRFDNPAAKIDQAVFNPARIIKLPGTWARKGDSVLDRPHRQSRLLEVPGCEGLDDLDQADIQAVSLALMEAIATEAPAEVRPTRQVAPSRNGTVEHRLDLARWLKDRGIGFKDGGRMDDGRHKYVLDACPFNPDHKAPDACFMQEPSGKPSFHCFHNSCAEFGWQEAKAAIGVPAPDHFDPPLPQPRPASSAGRSSLPQRVQQMADVPGEPQLTDEGNAARFSRLHGVDLHFCHPWSKWLGWDQVRWRADVLGAVMELAKDTIKNLASQAQREIFSLIEEGN